MTRVEVEAHRRGFRKGTLRDVRIEDGALAWARNQTLRRSVTDIDERGDPTGQLLELSLDILDGRSSQLNDEVLAASFPEEIRGQGEANFEHDG